MVRLARKLHSDPMGLGYGFHNFGDNRDAIHSLRRQNQRLDLWAAQGRHHCLAREQQGIALKLVCTLRTGGDIADLMIAD
jgi:hypothetical protein